MAEQRVQRRLAAILAADVVGYSRLMREDETGTLAQLKTLRKEVFDPRTAEHNGRIVKTTGDGVLVEFASAVDATEFAIKVQRALARRNEDVPEDRRIELRIGINLGDIIVDGDDIYGDGVNVAARLEGLCGVGEVYISAVVHDQVEGKLEAVFEDLGEHTVKNIDKPIRTYRVSSRAGSIEAPPPASDVDKLFDRPAVAVLPFENLSGDLDQDYFADGLSEDIVTALSLCRSFPVIARNSTFAYKGKSPDIRKVGAELDARYVIEGSVRRTGARVRVTAQLIDADTGHHVWAERYDRDLDDIFALQDELTQRIAATVVPELEHAEHKRSVMRLPQDLDAWMWYVRGTTALYEPTGEAARRAREMFARAVEIDPGYAKAYAGIAFSHALDLVMGTAESREGSIRELGTAAQQAVALDRDDPVAQTVISISYAFTGQDDLSITTAQRAIVLNPNNAMAYGHLGTLLDLTGRHEEGVSNLEHGLRLNPNEPITAHIHMTFLARAQLALRRYDEAIAWGREALARRAGYPPAHYNIAIALAHLGRSAEARAALEECERLQPGFVESRRGWRPYRDQAQNDHILDGLRKSGWEG